MVTAFGGLYAPLTFAIHEGVKTLTHVGEPFVFVQLKPSKDALTGGADLSVKLGELCLSHSAGGARPRIPRGELFQELGFGPPKVQSSIDVLSREINRGG